MLQSTPGCDAPGLWSVPLAVTGTGGAAAEGELRSVPGLALPSRPSSVGRAILGWRNAEEPELGSLPVLMEQQRGHGSRELGRSLQALETLEWEQAGVCWGKGASGRPVDG